MKSWMISEIKTMMAETGVTVVEADQCMYGLKTRGQDRKTEVPAKKPTKFMTMGTTPIRTEWMEEPDWQQRIHPDYAKQSAEA